MLPSKTIPQRLKPISFPATFTGTAQAVPLQNHASPLFQMRLPCQVGRIKRWNWMRPL
jgi:hypothetical protein